MPFFRPSDEQLSRLDDVLARSDSASSWQVFVLLHLLLAYWAVRYTLDPAYRTIADSALVPVHEMGHVVCGGLGMFIGVLGGSLFQWGAPLALTLAFLGRRDLYAFCVGLFVFGGSLNASYTYMDSSFQMEKYPDMTFVNVGGGEAVHDWQYLFGALGMYRSYTMVAMGFRVLGLLLAWTGVIAGGWILFRMARAVSRG